MATTQIPTTQTDVIGGNLRISLPANLRVKGGETQSESPRAAVQSKKIWIDLENSPHVPFFKPIIEELERRGHTVMLTARDCFQVCDLADLFQMKYRRVGRHYGKHMLAKLAGLGMRVSQMMPLAMREKPDLSLSHGSRSQFVTSNLLGIRTLTIFDYEHSRWVGIFKPTWVMAPEIIPETAVANIGISKDRLMRYPGIKEDVYAPSFTPDPSLRQRLGFQNSDLVVTLRPPATEAHYHVPESDQLLHAAFELFATHPQAKVVLVPRTPKQAAELRAQWPDMFARKQVIVPEHVVDGLDLIWASDLVISGGGTMNREAAALGVPVYSIFRGKIGAVDHYLADKGRLVLLQSPEDVRNRLKLVRRNRNGRPESGQHNTLHAVVDNIVSALESQ